MQNLLWEMKFRGRTGESATSSCEPCCIGFGGSKRFWLSLKEPDFEIERALGGGGGGAGASAPDG